MKKQKVEIEVITITQDELDKTQIEIKCPECSGFTYLDEIDTMYLQSHGHMMCICDNCGKSFSVKTT